MAFPDGPLGIKQEILINNVWTNVTARTRNSDDVNIRRGYSSEQADLTSSSCGFTLNNRDGMFSNKNPLSPYFGLLSRNTQYRTSVTELVSTLRLQDNTVASTGDYDLAEAWTADKAVLDVVGDIDVRMDIEPDNWRGTAGIILAGKYTLPSQLSWAMSILPTTGLLQIRWTTGGTAATLVAATSTVALPTQGRIAVRVTLDVDNGASGNTITFYTSPTISGTWTQLGAPVVRAGITSIFNSTSNLEIGNVNLSSRGNGIASSDPFVGRIYGFELRSGIGGTLVAKMDATSRTPGDTTWSDGLATPNTWMLRASAKIDDADYRFWGEIPKFPQRWDSTGTDVYTPLSASDIWQRLQQGAKPLNSAIYRNLSRYNVSGYWPMEDGSDSKQISAVTGKSTSNIPDVSFGSDSTLPGSSGVLTFTADTGYAGSTVDPKATGTANSAFASFFFKMPSVPISTIGPIANFYYDSGEIYRATISVGASVFTLNVTSADGTSLLSSNVSFGSGVSPDRWICMRLRFVKNGTGVDWAWSWLDVATSPAPAGTSGTIASTSIGKPQSWLSFPYTGKTGLRLAHVLLSRTDININDSVFVGSAKAWVGETVAERFGRLCREMNIPYWIVGVVRRVIGGVYVQSSAKMGPQLPMKLVDLLKECSALDGGFLYAPRDKFGVSFRLRSSILNLQALTLRYTANHLSGTLEPDEDDSFIRNDVTVTRINGGSGRKVKTSGSLNSNDPASDPLAVGLYDVSIQRNAFSDPQLQGLSELYVFEGTWDEMRYPLVEVNLARRQFVSDAALTAAIRRLDLGQPLTLSNLPRWLPPGDAELLMRGYTETLKNRGWVFKWNSSPYGTFRVNDTTGSLLSRKRAAASNSSVNTAFNSTALSISVKTPTGALWRQSSGAPAGTFPLDILLGGEVMTVSAITGSSSPQTFTISARSVNGIMKSHLANEEVQVVDKFYATL